MARSPTVPFGMRTLIRAPVALGTRARSRAVRSGGSRPLGVRAIAAAMADEGEIVTVQLERELAPADAARLAVAVAARLGVDAGKLERLLIRRGTRDLTRPIPTELAARVAAAFEDEGVAVALAPGRPRAFPEGWGRRVPTLPSLAVAIWGGLSGVVVIGYLLLAAPGRFTLF